MKTIQEIDTEIAELNAKLEDLKIDRKLTAAKRVMDYDLTEVQAKIASGWFLRESTTSGYKVIRIFEVGRYQDTFEVRAASIEVEDMGWRVDIYCENNYRLYVDNLLFEKCTETSQELFDTLTNYISKIKNS